MCGIVGFYNYKTRAPVSRTLLRRARDLQLHRGPDQAGEYFDDDAGVALGNCRLSIIDLVSGDQPIGNEDGTVQVVYNGEIYNFAELRDDLVRRGHRFATSGDTEVIVHAYEEYGVSCPERFNGIFAFALWDGRKRRLYLARDHFGVKPLYYSTTGGVLRFASELKSILADPTMPREIELDALNLCLTFRYAPSPWTMFKGVSKLPPGSFAVIDENGSHVQQYWNGISPTLEDASAEELVARLQELLAAAVKRQMVADVPVSLSLSSGIDSSTLGAIMATCSNEPLRAFTVGFAGREEASEIGPAAETARLFDMIFQSRVVSQEDYATFLDRFSWHLEEPIGNESAPAYYFVAQLAHAAGIKVMLNGQGPDEVFGGYSRHVGASYGDVLAGVSSGLARYVLAPLAEKMALPEKYRRLAYALEANTEVDQFLSIYTFVPPEIRVRLLNPALTDLVNPDLPRAFVESKLAQAPPGTRLERMLFIDTRTSLPDNLLLCEDKMAMAASVEARVPFLDRDFMELAERVPGSLKVHGGRGKRIHRQVCSGFVSASIVRRPKIGFDTAFDLWLRQSLGETLCTSISEADSFTNTYLSRPTVEGLIAQHRTARWDHQHLLFLLLTMESWYRTFFVRQVM